MIDLTVVLESVALRGAPWRSEDGALVALSALVRGRGLHLDWDRGAGEHWIRLISGSDAVILVSTVAPIAFAVPPSTTWLADSADRVQIVEADSFHTDLFTCDETSLESIFPGATASPGFAASAFSVMDLWYVTV